jgi:hypothetical protein
MRKQFVSTVIISLFLLGLVSVPASASSPIFDGMFVAWTGNGEWDYNGLKSAIKISARLQSTKSTTGYTISVSGSISGIPRTIPLLTQTVAFKASGANRTITYNNVQYYSPFWIDSGKNVGDRVQIGAVSSPYTFDLQTYEAREILGKSIRCLVTAYSIKLPNPASTTTITGRAFYDAYSGVFVAGTMDYLFTSLQSPYYEKITAQVTLSETNVEIGGPSLPWWLIPVTGVVVAVIIIGVAFAVVRLRKKRRRSLPSITGPKGGRIIPSPPPSSRPSETAPLSPPISTASPGLPPPLDESPIAPPQPTAPLPAPDKTCRICGVVLRDGWTFCGDCGAPVKTG